MKKQFSAQPLLNGIIIRKDNHECSATLNNNQIVIKKTHFTDTKQFDNLINIPLMRGIIATINYFTMFIKALNKSEIFKCLKDNLVLLGGEHRALIAPYNLYSTHKHIITKKK